MSFITKDNGKHHGFDTGAKRDTNEGKPRFDLISPLALNRIAHLMRRGAEKYGERNREKGIPIERMYESALRHLMQRAMGDTEEDHLSAVCFNVMGIMHYQEMDMLDAKSHITKRNREGDKNAGDSTARARDMGMI